MSQKLPPAVRKYLAKQLVKARAAKKAKSRQKPKATVSKSKIARMVSKAVTEAMANS